MQRVGVCSWSLQPTDPLDLAEKAREVGVDAVQLALDPLRAGAWSVDATVRTLHDAGIEIRSGMMTTVGEDYATLETIRKTGGIRPDHTWEENYAAARDIAKLVSEMRIPLVTFHAGFIPEWHSDHSNRPESSHLTVLDTHHPELPKLLERVGAIADVFAEHRVTLGLETGQEHAEPLRQFLAALDRRNVGVNFDPANIILYGVGNPIAALRMLAGRVVQMHIKDARPAALPGEWGEEVRVGDGAVDWTEFIIAVEELTPNRDMMIERESGTSRIADARRAREFLAHTVLSTRMRSRGRRGNG